MACPPELLAKVEETEKFIPFDMPQAESNGIQGRATEMKTLVLVVLLVSILAMPAFAIDYTLTDLGRGAATGINNSGQITGFRYDPESGKDIGFFWDKALGFIYIGSSIGRDINNRGQVTGGAWIWENGKDVVALPVPSTIGSVTGSAINDNMQVAGSGSKTSDNYDALVWTDLETCVNLGIWDNPHSWAYDINQSGTVVGEFWPSPGENHGFLWSSSSGFVDLNGLGTSFASANGINDLEQVVGGYYTQAGLCHAFLWSATNGLLDLGTLIGDNYHSCAYRINNHGQVVGGSMVEPGNPNLHAFLWSSTDGMVELNVPGGCAISRATDINSFGHIVGSFVDRSGIEHIALWQPVPEPTSLLVLCGGIVGLLVFHRRKR